MKPFFSLILFLIVLNGWMLYFPNHKDTARSKFSDQSYCHLVGQYQLTYQFDQDKLHQADFSIRGPKGMTTATLTRSYNSDDIFLQYPITNDDHYIAEYYSPIIPLMLQKDGTITTFKLHHWVFSSNQCHSRPI